MENYFEHLSPQLKELLSTKTELLTETEKDVAKQWFTQLESNPPSSTTIFLKQESDSRTFREAVEYYNKTHNTNYDSRYSAHFIYKDLSKIKLVELVMSPLLFYDTVVILS